MKSGPFLSIPNFIKSKLLCCIFGIMLYHCRAESASAIRKKDKKRGISAARRDFWKNFARRIPHPACGGREFPLYYKLSYFSLHPAMRRFHIFPKGVSHEKSADSSAVPRDALLPRCLRAERRRFDRRRAVHARLRLCRLHAHRSRDGRALRDQSVALQRTDRARRQ